MIAKQLLLRQGRVSGSYDLMQTWFRNWWVLALCAIALAWTCGYGIVQATEIIPPIAQIKSEHPRLLVRPRVTPWAVSTTELRAQPQDQPDREMLAQLRAEKSASAQAMVWLLTGEKSAAERALATLLAYRFPGEVDTFHTYFTLTQFGLAYDWLYDYEGFTPETKARVRAKVLPLVQRGLRDADDHMFHNYIWMSAGGVAIWALATVGEDAQANQAFERVRDRFNTGLFPAWKYLDGLPSEPMGYWALYVFTPGMLTVLAAQSASETDLVGLISRSDGDWLNRHFENLIQSTLPDMRYVPWGDLQSGPNGGVTYEMAGTMEALTWATHSPHGACFSAWLAQKRGLKRFHGDTAIYYFLYKHQVPPAVPPLSFLAGNHQSGHFIARSGWDGDATLVTLRATDHFGDHHHYDQGSFIIYRHGLLAVDPPIYQKVRGPQQPTEVHNTLLFDGQGQRPVRGQWFKTIPDFQKNLAGGAHLETGDILFSKEAGSWAAVAGQYAQAYSTQQVQSCVRQLLFLRPGKIVVVDQLVLPATGKPSEVQWLLQLPAAPVMEKDLFWATNRQSWLQCRALQPGSAVPVVEPTAVKTHRVSLRYLANGPLRIAHLLEVGDGLRPDTTAVVTCRELPHALEVVLDGVLFRFATEPPFVVEGPEGRRL